MMSVSIWILVIVQIVLECEGIPLYVTEYDEQKCIKDPISGGKMSQMQKEIDNFYLKKSSQRQFHSNSFKWAVEALQS